MQLVGNALAPRHRIMGTAQANDRPDLLWDYPWLDRIYARLEGEYELDERADVLERKFVALGDVAEILLDIVRDKRERPAPSLCPPAARRGRRQGRAAHHHRLQIRPRQKRGRGRRRRIARGSLFCWEMVHPTGFEPVTPAFGGQYSIQLSYGCLAEDAVSSGGPPMPARILPQIVHKIAARLALRQATGAKPGPWPIHHPAPDRAARPR